MTASDLIRRAENAARTNQPNMCALYMKRAGEVLKVERAQIRADWYKARTDKLNVAFEILADAFRPIGEAFSATAASLAKFAAVWETPNQEQFGRVS